jgi:hypothetical protein
MLRHTERWLLEEWLEVKRVASSSYQCETRDDFSKLIRQRPNENECEKFGSRATLIAMLSC